VTPSPTFQDLIRVAREKLKDNGDRIAAIPHPFRNTWWPDEPTMQDELLSDRGISRPPADIEKVFAEEVTAIRDALGELGLDSDVADDDAGDRIMRLMNTQAKALSLWDQIGIPVRRLGNVVIRIRAPRDVMGAPIVQALTIDAYIRGAGAKTADDAVKLADLRRQLERWRSATVLL